MNPLAGLNLGMRSPHGLGLIFEGDDFVIAEQVRGFGTEDLVDFGGEFSDFGFGVFAASQFDEMSPGPRVGGDEDFGFGCIGEYRSGCLARHFSALRFVFDLLQSGGQTIDQFDVGGVAFADGRQPGFVQFRVFGDDVGLHEIRVRFIDVALRQLGITEPRAMPNEFVGQASRDSGENKIPHGVFKHRTVADFEQVLQVFGVSTGARFGETHVANPSRHFTQLLTRHLRIRLPRLHSVIRQKTIQLFVVESLPADQIHLWFANNTHIVFLFSNSTICCRLRSFKKTAGKL